MGELFDQSLNFAPVALDDTPLIRAQRHLFKVAPDGRFVFQRLASCTPYREIKVATCTRHPVRTRAPDGFVQ